MQRQTSMLSLNLLHIFLSISTAKNLSTRPTIEYMEARIALSTFDPYFQTLHDISGADGSNISSCFSVSNRHASFVLATLAVCWLTIHLITTSYNCRALPSSIIANIQPNSPLLQSAVRPPLHLLIYNFISPSPAPFLSNRIDLFWKEISSIWP